MNTVALGDRYLTTFVRWSDRVKAIPKTGLEGRRH